MAANTWRAGWTACCVGVAMAEDGSGSFGGVLPLDDVGSGDIDLAGRFAEFLERLRSVVDAFGTPKPLDAWAAAIGRGRRRADGDHAPRRVAARAARPAARGRRQRGDGRRPAPSPVALSCEIRALLADRLRGRPTRANFRTGHLTICTLVPMRRCRTGSSA